MGLKKYFNSMDPNYLNMNWTERKSSNKFKVLILLDAPDPQERRLRL